MKNKNQIGFLIILIAVVYYALAFIIMPPILYGTNRRVETPAPDHVVRDFYDWYLSYEGNPLTDQAYRSNAAISEEFVGRLDEQVSGELIADPILCAQDVPESVVVSTPEVLDDSASVEVETSFGNRFTVQLILQENDWKISEVICE